MKHSAHVIIKVLMEHVYLCFLNDPNHLPFSLLLLVRSIVMVPLISAFIFETWSWFGQDLEYLQLSLHLVNPYSYSENIVNLPPLLVRPRDVGQLEQIDHV